MDALHRLATEGAACCRFHRSITGDLQNPEATEEEVHGDRDNVVANTVDAQTEVDIQDGLNRSQRIAVQASQSAQISLIWGPPGTSSFPACFSVNGIIQNVIGTGKTTVVVQILRHLVERLEEGGKILMTASTHNGMPYFLQQYTWNRPNRSRAAVDNVLERFEKLMKEVDLVPVEQVLRVATDSSRVNKSVKSFTVESRVGGEINRNSSRREKAEKLIKRATIVFTTCAGAGLGILRGVDFDVALIDEASQVTESVALIPLVKGCKKAIMVGDQYVHLTQCFALVLTVVS